MGWLSVRFTRMPDVESPPRDDGAALSATSARNRMSRRGCLDSKAFLAALREMADDDDADELRIHILSLADFRDAVAGKWNRLSTLIVVAVEVIARKHMNLATDIFTQFDSELSFMAIPQTPRHEARTRVAAIARDVAGHLFGDTVVNGRRPQVIVTSLPLSKALALDGNIDRRAVDLAVTRAGALLKPAHTETETAPPLSAPHRSALEALMQEPGSPLSGTAPASVSGGAPYTSESAADWYDEQIDSLASVRRKSDSAMTGDTKLSLLWTPTWVTAQKTMGAFHARLIRIDRDGTPPLEGCHAYADAKPVEILTLDRFVATGAARELKALFFSGRRSGLTVPFHWQSLAPRWRDCVRLPILDCPPAARRKLLKVEIFGLTSALPANLFDKMFEPIEAMGCDVMARLPLSEVDVIPLLRSVKAVGIDLAELKDNDRVGDEILFERICRFREIARVHKLACYIWGVRHRPMIAKVLDSGFSLINGPGVMCDLSHPTLPRHDRKAA